MCNWIFSVFIYMYGILLLSYSSGKHQQLDFTASSCRYEIHTHQLNWEEAVQACKQRNKTLVKIEDDDEMSSIKTVIESAASIASSSFADLQFWVGLHYESTGTISSIHWGDCIHDDSITRRHSNLNTEDGYTSACGVVSKLSLKITSPCTSTSLFVCEDIEGEGDCFSRGTFMIATKLGYDESTSLRLTECASACNSDASCAAFRQRTSASCTLLTLKSDLSSSFTLSGHHKVYNKVLIYPENDYSHYSTGLLAQELCNDLGSPIVATPINLQTSMESIIPTTTEKITEIVNRDTLEITTERVHTSERTYVNDTTAAKNTEDHSSPINADTTPELTTENIFIVKTTVEVITPNVTHEDELTTPDITTPQVTTVHDSANVLTNDNYLTSETTTSENKTPNLTYEDNSTLEIEDSTTAKFEMSTLLQIMESTSHSTEAVNTTSMYSSTCVCHCIEKNITLNDKMKEMVSVLTLDKTLLSSTKRKLRCADDNRPSARTLGYVGILFFAICGLLFVTVDAIRIFQMIQKNDKRNS